MKKKLLILLVVMLMMCGCTKRFNVTVKDGVKLHINSDATIISPTSPL